MTELDKALRGTSLLREVRLWGTYFHSVDRTRLRVEASKDRCDIFQSIKNENFSF